MYQKLYQNLWQILDEIMMTLDVPEIDIFADQEY